jgi:hypothetical protein
LPDDGEILAELDDAETRLISVLVWMHVLVATPTQGLQIRNEWAWIERACTGSQHSALAV